MRLYRIKDAAAEVGVSEPTFYRDRQAGLVPEHIDECGKTYFLAGELRHLKRNRATGPQFRLLRARVDDLERRVRSLEARAEHAQADGGAA